MRRFVAVIGVLLILVCAGCSNERGNEKPSESTSVMTSHKLINWDKVYEVDDFSSVVLGKTRLEELYEMVGETPYILHKKEQSIEVYPLSDGKYMNVIYWESELKTEFSDLTVDEMTITSENLWQIQRDKKYDLKEFDCIVVGKTTLFELHEMVEPAAYGLTLNTKVIDIYPLSDGKYLNVICWYHHTDGGFDWTIDEVQITDDNPADR
ncbi:MAG: hypothetical protein IJB96_03130 [Lachnospira sp.]|nr:hypothetical protein [Lachnospira sp.]